LGFQIAKIRGLGPALQKPLAAHRQFILANEFQELGVAESIGGGFLQTHGQGFDQAGLAQLF
jgi:hypothetical protein